VVLVEQRVDAVLKLADTVAFMRSGRIEESMPVNGLQADADVFRTYVGV
jgi:branched-chain amino acid transport system ATP-binding protein